MRGCLGHFLMPYAVAPAPCEQEIEVQHKAKCGFQNSWVCSRPVELSAHLWLLLEIMQ